MKLFFKIFLWFLAATTLLVGLMIFLNWSMQTEPVVSRWQQSIRNQTKVYAGIASQVYNAEGKEGIAEFARTVKMPNSVGEIAVFDQSGNILYAENADFAAPDEFTSRAFASDDSELDLVPEKPTRSAHKFTTKDGQTFLFMMKWERLKPVEVFGESWRRYVRYLGLLLTAVVLCYALALYLSRPIEKIRSATQRFADGDLTTRVAETVKKRRDELGDLAKDFDEMAERIESLVKSQQRLSRDVSHELRSPLARMNVALEIAKQRSTPEIKPTLDRIETESNRLNTMIGSILTLSKLESGSTDFDRHEVDLTGIVEQVVQDADFEAHVKGRSVKLVKSEEMRIRGVENLLHSAVDNVVRNALKYTPEDSTVEVSLSRSNGKAFISVRDHGEGVPTEELDKLFTPFYRVGEARERQTGGIGLGLAIAKQAVRLHKGTIKAKNSSPGLTVEISLELGLKD